MHPIGMQDVMGFAAAAATIFAFAQTATLRMRVAAATSNLFFIVYGVLGGLYPPLILHSILLPLNLARVVRELRARESGRNDRC